MTAVPITVERARPDATAYAGPDACDRASCDAVALIASESAVCASNYAPLPIVVARAEDVWVSDVDTW
jgi:ornithine--oxo-acid transaminase